MNVDPRQAEESLRTIEQARQVASRHSLNNGVILLVWGAVVVLCLISFDVFPLVFSSIAIGAAVAAVVTGIAAGLTGFWTARYGQSLPVHPLRMEHPRIVVLWAFYYVIVLFGGIFGALLLLHRFPPFMFTVLGLVAAAPLLIKGGLMWRSAYGQEI